MTQCGHPGVWERRPSGAPSGSSSYNLRTSLRSDLTVLGCAGRCPRLSHRHKAERYLQIAGCYQEGGLGANPSDSKDGAPPRTLDLIMPTARFDLNLKTEPREAC